MGCLARDLSRRCSRADGRPVGCVRMPHAIPASCLPLRFKWMAPAYLYGSYDMNLSRSTTWQFGGLRWIKRRQPATINATQRGNPLYRPDENCS